MEKHVIKINDFGMFVESVKSLTKMSESAKFNVSENGLVVNGKNSFSKCELTTDAIASDSSFFFCIKELGTFVRVLNTVKDIQDEDFTDLKVVYDGSFVKFSSKKIKTKYSVCQEAAITDCISSPAHEMTTKCEFTTTSDYIKRVNSHTFMFKDLSSVRIYLDKNHEMENNAIYATIGNAENDLENSMTVKVGLLNYGDFDEKVIIDFDRLNIFNMMPSDDIRLHLMNEKKAIMSETNKTGKNGTFFKLKVYVWLLVK